MMKIIISYSPSTYVWTYCISMCFMNCIYRPTQHTTNNLILPSAIAKQLSIQSKSSISFYDFYFQFPSLMTTYKLTHIHTLIPLGNSYYKLIIFCPRGTNTEAVIASLISNTHEGNTSVHHIDSVFMTQQKKSSHFIVLGTGCLICLQMCSDLISIPLPKLRELSQRVSESCSVPANVGWTPACKVLRFTLAKINLTGLSAKYSR